MPYVSMRTIVADNRTFIVDDRPKLADVLGMTTAITDQVGHTPKTLRQRLTGWSQRVLAARAGVAVNTVGAIEGGLHVSTRAVEKVAKALGICAWELFRAMEQVHRPVSVRVELH